MYKRLVLIKIKIKNRKSIGDSSSVKKKSELHRLKKLRPKKNDRVDSPKEKEVKSKGATPTRISRRQGGNDSEVIKLSGNNHSTKALIKGGRAGRIKSSDSNWEYFITSNKATLCDPELHAEIIERNKNVFTNVEEVIEK